MTAIWLFLYLGGLVRMLTLYRLDLNHPAIILVALPILAMPLLDRLCRHQSWVISKGMLRGAGILALLSALTLARLLDLGFWETRNLGLAGLCALLGLSLTLVAHDLPREGAGPGLWIWIAAWEYAGSWHPVLTALGAGLAAFLAAFGYWPDGESVESSTRRVSPFGTLMLLGLVLPKPWFDFQMASTWALAMAVFALAVGVVSLPRLRGLLARLPSAWPLILLALAFFVYPTAWALFWAATVGLVWGILWPRLPRPLPLTRVSLGFVLGLLLSFALHSNLGIPYLRPLIWWGS